MAWNDKTYAQRFTYTNFIMLDELSGVPYDAAGSRTMDSMAFFPSGGTATERTNAATLFAKKLDLRFINDRDAVYEPDVDKGAARQALTNVLRDTPKTLEDVATTVDVHYKFEDEA